MNKAWKKWRLLAVALAANGALATYDPALAMLALRKSGEFLLLILTILPPVMVLMGLLDVWTPRKLVEDNLGRGSGLKGAALAMLMGTVAAGPIYAAFPLAQTLLRKGARVANISIFLGTWACIKIPMIVMESGFVGVRFALVRLALTIPGVLLAGYVLERLVPAGLPEVEPPDATDGRDGAQAFPQT